MVGFHTSTFLLGAHNYCCLILTRSFPFFFFGAAFFFFSQLLAASLVSLCFTSIKQTF